MLLSLLYKIIYQHILTKEKKDTLVLSEWPTHRLDAITVTAEAKYYINFPKPKI